MKSKMNGLFTKKNLIIGITSIVLLSALFGDDVSEKPTQKIKSDAIEIKQTGTKIDICDGVNITKNCEQAGIQYLVYKYYPATAEVSHYETKTTYTQEVVGYCTSCNDGTRSPSCATGRGTCSHHGGVAEWNAPIYENVSKEEQIKVIDSPAVEERYEKVIKEN